jgi:hypothetical protein
MFHGVIDLLFDVAVSIGRWNSKANSPGNSVFLDDWPQNHADLAAGGAGLVAYDASVGPAAGW